MSYWRIAAILGWGIGAGLPTVAFALITSPQRYGPYSIWRDPGAILMMYVIIVTTMLATLVSGVLQTRISPLIQLLSIPVLLGIAAGVGSANVEILLPVVYVSILVAIGRILYFCLAAFTERTRLLTAYAVAYVVVFGVFVHPGYHPRSSMLSIEQHLFAASIAMAILAPLPPARLLQ